LEQGSVLEDHVAKRFCHFDHSLHVTLAEASMVEEAAFEAEVET